MESIFRINDFSVIRMSNMVESRTFYKCGDSTIQYVLDDETAWGNTVWANNFYPKRLNKMYSNTSLIPYRGRGWRDAYQVQTVEILLRQGYNFAGKFGLLLVLKDQLTNTYFCSKVLYESDFKITSNKELIDGSFWMIAARVYVPTTMRTLGAQIIELNYDDIALEGDNIGYIYNYPVDFEPLIPDKPIPDYILVKAEFDENFYLQITPYTSELNKSLEQTILDYFDLDLADIDLSYKIAYGNDQLGYKTIRLKNEDNQFMPIKFGLDISDYPKTTITTDKNVLVTIVMEVNVNNRLMTRTINLNTNILTVINPLISDRIVKPSISYPVNISHQTVISQNVIDHRTERQVITVQQPVFVEMISEDLVIANKNISFYSLMQPSYLIIGKTKSTDEQIVQTHTTVDGKYYFDLNDIIPVDEETTYQIINIETQKIVGQGTVKLEYEKSGTVVSKPKIIKSAQQATLADRFEATSSNRFDATATNRFDTELKPADKNQNLTKM